MALGVQMDRAQDTISCDTRKIAQSSTNFGGQGLYGLCDAMDAAEDLVSERSIWLSQGPGQTAAMPWPRRSGGRRTAY